MEANSPATDIIRILLVDDHAMFRDGVARMLDKEPDIEVTAQVASATEGLAVLSASNANLVLLDVDLGSERALDFVKGARAAGFESPILIVTAGMSDREAIQLVQAGVSGILHKHHSTGVLCSTIRRIAAGEVCLENAYLASLFRAADRTRVLRRAALTERDRTVMRAILQGLSNRDIARRIEISEGAVKASVRYLCDKLGVRTRSQLVKVALEQYKDEL